MVPFDQPEAALVCFYIVGSRTPHTTNSTPFAGSHHKVGQERPTHKLSRSLFRHKEGWIPTAYTNSVDGSNGNRKLDTVRLRLQSARRRYPSYPGRGVGRLIYIYGCKKYLHCPKQLERYNDIYEDLVMRCESTRRITRIISFSCRQRSATTKRTASLEGGGRNGVCMKTPTFRCLNCHAQVPINTTI